MDTLVWRSTPSSTLRFKNAYEHVQGPVYALLWTKQIWRACIPPSRSFILWRFIQHKTPTDDALQSRGLIPPSICCHCERSAETAEHIFLECPFAVEIWQWFSCKIHKGLDISSPQTLLNFGADVSPQMKDLILAGIVNIFWSIWRSRNSLRFQNCRLQLVALKADISAAIAISACTLTCRSSQPSNPLLLRVIRARTSALNLSFGFPHVMAGLK